MHQFDLSAVNLFTCTAIRYGANRATHWNLTEFKSTELTRFRFWRTEQWACRASPMVIGWCARAPSHVDTDAVRKCLL